MADYRWNVRRRPCQPLAKLAMRRLLHILLALFLGVLCASDACAYFPIRVRPSAVVAQADLIVVGRLKEGSVERVSVKVNCDEPDKSAIHIYEINTGPYKMGDGDLRTDHVWFVSSGSHLPGLKPDANVWCVDDAQIIKPLKLKESYLAIPKQEDDFPL